MYKGLWVRLADLDSFILKYSMKMKLFGLIETKLFHFHRILKNGGLGGGSSKPILDLPLGRFYCM